MNELKAHCNEILDWNDLVYNYYWIVNNDLTLVCKHPDPKWIHIIHDTNLIKTALCELLFYNDYEVWIAPVKDNQGNLTPLGIKNHCFDLWEEIQ